MSASIVIVDDERDVAELFRQRFRREARQGTYVMHFAASGEEALGLLAGPIEPQLIVILSDINMPGMDGLELLSAVKQRFPDLPVMMVTAYGDDERRRRAAEHGAAEFFTKPVDFDLLKTLLRQMPKPRGLRELAPQSNDCLPARTDRSSDRAKGRLRGSALNRCRDSRCAGVPVGGVGSELRARL